MFSIDADKNITSGEVESPGPLQFASEAQLTTLADREGLSRQDLEAIWNGFAGVVPFDALKPVKKFRNRPYGIAQIWKAIQRLNGNDTAGEPEAIEEPAEESVKRLEPAGPAEQSEDVENEDSMKKKMKTKVKRAAKARAAKPKVERTPRVKGDSKKDQALKMMLRKTGATASDLKERLGWSPVSVAMLVQWVQLVTRAGVTSLTVEKNSAGERVYKAA